MQDNKNSAVARDAIIQLGPESKDFPAIGLFASHHLKELQGTYWNEHLGTSTPSLAQVLSLLEPVDEEDIDEELVDIEMIDLSLPGNVTQYVLCVQLDEFGVVRNVSMES